MTLTGLKVKALAAVAFVATLAAFFFRARQKGAEADLAEDRLEYQKARGDTLQKISDNRNELAEKHRDEDLKDKASIARGDRNHLDGTW